jgi:hypothetical protein
MMSDHQSVQSTNITSLAYDPDTQTLEVTFSSGSADSLRAGSGPRSPRRGSVE